MERTISIRDGLIAQADQARRIMAEGRYEVDGRTIDLTGPLTRSRSGTRLIRPGDWDGLIADAMTRCRRPQPAGITVAAETTLQALERLSASHGEGVAALNFASARRPGGGWDTGAQAQEETLARASGLIASLAEAPDYYSANRQHANLFSTEHAIWSPQVPCFARDDGTLLHQPYAIGLITMPAPNVGAMPTLSEGDCLALPGVWRRRIACVLAVAVANGVRHLILGAWGCGAFGNDPLLVARCFRDVLVQGPWRSGFESVVFAIHDTTRRQSCLAAFRTTLATAEAP